MRLELPPAGFCVLTGETGAGKSLLLEALAAAVGGKFGSVQIRPGATRAEVSAAFGLATEAAGRLEAAGFDAAESQLLVRRVAETGKRPRNYINGSPCTAAQLASACAGLLSVFSQHEHIQLRSHDRRRELLDGFAGATGQAREVSAAHAAWRAARNALDQAERNEQQATQERDDLASKLAEIDEGGQNPEAYAANSALLSKHGNAAELADAAATLKSHLAEASAAALRARQAAERVGELDPSAGELAELAGGAEALTSDALRAAEKRFAEDGQVDQQALAAAEDFVAETHRLMRRHRCVSPSALYEIADGMRERLEQMGSATAATAAAAEAAARGRWSGAAAKLTAMRAAGAKRLAASVSSRLRKLGMAGGGFRIELAKRAGADPSPHGEQDIGFFFAARAREQLRDVSSAASGGELSRLALAVYAAAGGDGRRALVFDEVDTGIGGKVAAAVGTLLADLGRRRLVLSVTHLPQVAAAADRHWRIASDAAGSVRLAELDDAQRAEEVARMLAGKKITEASRRNAREIIAAARAA